MEGTKPRGGYLYRLLSRYTSFWQNRRCRFSFCIGFRGRTFFLVAANNPECVKYMSYTYHSKKYSTNNTNTARYGFSSIGKNPRCDEDMSYTIMASVFNQVKI